jgi:hypothetical protein
MVGTTQTSFFCLWHISRIWPILPQLVHVDVDFVVTCVTGLTIVLTSNVVSKTL